VQGARTFISRQLDDWWGLGGQSGGSGGQGLGQFAARLANLVPARLARQTDEGTVTSTGRGSRSGNSGAQAGGTTGPGALGKISRTGKPARGGNPKLVGSPVLRIHEGRPFLMATVQAPASDRERVLTADVEVVVEGGGKEGEPPAGAAFPQVLQWQSATTGAVIRGASMLLSPGNASDWYVFATYVQDAVVRFKVRQEVRDAG
jgi:hypothetical protein